RQESRTVTVAPRPTTRSRSTATVARPERQQTQQSAFESARRQASARDRSNTTTVQNSDVEQFRQTTSPQNRQVTVQPRPDSRQTPPLVSSAARRNQNRSNNIDMDAISRQARERQKEIGSRDRPNDRDRDYGNRDSDRHHDHDRYD